MRLPMLTVMLLIFIIWLQYEIRSSSRSSKKKSELFWKRENESNSSRRKDISELEYITLQTERLPLADHEDATVNSYRDTILKLSDKKAINLTGISNTDLKLKYGASNINLLSEYDNNYILIVSILQKWAERLYRTGSLEDSLTVLEYAVSLPTDVTKSYKLLAEIYRSRGSSDKIDALIQLIAKTKITNKDKLINELIMIKQS